MSKSRHGFFIMHFFFPLMNFLKIPDISQKISIFAMETFKSVMVTFVKYTVCYH